MNEKSEYGQDEIDDGANEEQLDIKDKLISYWIIGSLLCIIFTVNSHIGGDSLFQITESKFFQFFIDYLIAASPLGAAVGCGGFYLFVWIMDEVFGKIVGKGNILRFFHNAVKYIATKVIPFFFRTFRLYKKQSDYFQDALNIKKSSNVTTSVESEKTEIIE